MTVKIWWISTIVWFNVRIFLMCGNIRQFLTCLMIFADYVLVNRNVQTQSNPPPPHTFFGLPTRCLVCGAVFVSKRGFVHTGLGGDSNRCHGDDALCSVACSDPSVFFILCPARRLIVTSVRVCVWLCTRARTCSEWATDRHIKRWMMWLTAARVSDHILAVLYDTSRERERESNSDINGNLFKQ